MISPNTPLYVYEITGKMRHHLGMPPNSFVGLWNEDDSSFLFFTDKQDDYVNRCLDRCNSTLIKIHHTFYHEWQDTMPESGVSIGPLLFVPDDHPSPPEAALSLDPSVMFGDGSHPTTAACLGFMLELITEVPVESMLDLGTGTGILSVAAAALNVDRIVAVDNNVLAVQTALKNVRINHFDSRVTVREGDARKFISGGYDLAVGNLPFEILRSIGEFREIAEIPRWIISGISDFQGAVLEKSFAQKGFERTKFRKHFPWVSFVMSRVS